MSSAAPYPPRTSFFCSRCALVLGFHRSTSCSLGACDLAGGATVGEGAPVKPCVDCAFGFDC